MTTDSIIKVNNVSKSFHVGNQDVPVLKDISFEVNSGDFLIIFGPSGCGKSTLLHLILGLEEPTFGQVSFLGKNIWNKTTEDERSDLRKKHIGMVYQQPNWIKSLTVVENVAFPLLLLGINKIQTKQKALEMLRMVHMDDWANYIPTELSSGQQQRVALARAMVTGPSMIIADEPTGNLDYESGQGLMQLLTDLNQKQGKTIVMVTHDLEYLNYAKTAIRMFNGEVVGVYGDGEKEKLMTEIKSKRGNGIK
jgi:putative ABC transport system ATP-binding protein